MDLVGAEGRRGGTRGGRGQFSWEGVAANERGYYLGNSVAPGADASMPPSSRRRAAAAGPADWYNRPPPGAPRAKTTSGTRPPENSCPQDENMHTTSMRDVPAEPIDEADAIRRQEKAMLDAALGGRAFSDAVRAALAESVAESLDDGAESAEVIGVHDSRRREDVESKGSSGIVGGSEAGSRNMSMASKEAREEKSRRKAERARRREDRRLRRAKRRDSSESERESLRSRRYEESDRRRRRRERESDREEENRRSTRRPRSDDDDDASDSDDVPPPKRRARHRYSSYV